MPLKLMCITNNERIARIYESNGVDWIFVDLEVNGKRERQQHVSSVISDHHIDDVKVLSSVLTKAKLLVRINPINEFSKEEIDAVIINGADIIMLPYFKEVKEVEEFLNYVDGRIETCLLLETSEAVDNIDSILSVPGINYIHIGLNDLHLSYKMNFMFELLADGTVEKLCLKIREKNIPYGFGGVAQLGHGALPAEHIIAEHYRLQSSMVILSRTFCNVENMTNLDEINNIFSTGIKNLRQFEKSLTTKPQAYFIRNKETIIEKVSEIISNI
ncbi:aldolase/citrate lyase family protein [Ornithinibacillus halotolerans]|uniref:HpcH/HpaI aldolase/citrate lyase domain-containing protein n=1 Tax=Ornithinibacillus halotolerans TaxID=1274357 RepID=A0A916RWN5_9BACI|nr:aldolase/citrate lyase family protein [Ornithinibacillus halotolerans]GGA72857.1 hypothetical protein GCM10008025_15800 [Ornithinibacillus halotolerans]